ncbi:unnamed protein product, partial [marine sediment metagenome]
YRCRSPSAYDHQVGQAIVVNLAQECRYIFLGMNCSVGTYNPGVAVG